MRLTCEKQDLASGINLALRAISGRALLPILSGILFEAEEGLCLRATDLEMGLQVNVPAEVEVKGKVVLPGKIVGEMVRALPGGRVTIQMGPEDSQALLTCGDLSLKVNTYEADQFPPMGSNLEEAVSYNLAADFLPQIAKYVAVAAAREDVRGVFSGLLWEDPGDGRVTVVGSDTYRMAWMHSTLEREPGRAVRAVIPSRAVLDAARVEVEEGTAVRLSLTESHAAFAFSEVLIMCRLFGLGYPDYHAVIPVSFGTRITCSGHQLAEAVERAGLLAKEEESKVRANLVNLDITGHTIRVSSQASQLGTFSDTVPARIEGQPGVITFNARYLLEGLKAHEGGDIDIEVARSFEGVIIKSVERPDVCYLGVPVRLE